jgi:mono/diheme cytochrome c family protein
MPATFFLLPAVTSRLTWSVVVALAVVMAPARASEVEKRNGELIYKQQCAWCHGPTGQGTKKHYNKPLIGSRSVAQLAQLVEKTMPEDNPGTCTGDEARQVAAYIYDAFYSETARARNAPARIELARLTVHQYLNVVADLVGSFRGSGGRDNQRGLKGEYFGSRKKGGRKPLLARTDAEVRFAFGTGSPDPARIEPKEFRIQWNGSVLPPETGEYEFIVRSDNGARLWVNDPARPLIDAWVKSGKDTEYRGAVRLLAGRAYPLRLEFFKAAADKTASVTLAWKPPQQAEEVIPQRNLAPLWAPENFVVTTPFPPDDRSVGYERGTSISRAWVQATEDGSLEVAAYVASHLNELAGVAEGRPDREKRVRDFCRRFAERAFRRPLTEEQNQFYVDRAFAGAPDLETAVKRVVLLLLNSPRFLYTENGGSLDGYDVASRLALGLWDSLPDPELLKVAAAGRLATRAEVTRQAERMLADPRARAKLGEFFLQWLKVDVAPDLSKNRKLFPGFDQAIASDLRTSLLLFVDEVLGSEASDFRQLLCAEHVYLNGRLARFYGSNLSADAPFQKVNLGAGKRSGVLSHPYVMAAFAYTNATSPIHRGVFLARSLLGQSLRPPPEAVAPLAPDLHPDLTTRERVLLQTKPQSCQSCHGVINPLGFTLEHFDAVGRYRNQERGRPINATGAYQTRSGALVKFTGVRDLATFLAGSEEVHEAFVEQMFHHVIRQPVRAYGVRLLPELRQSFTAQGCSIRKLVIEIAAVSALQPRAVRAAATPPLPAR